MSTPQRPVQATLEEALALEQHRAFLEKAQQIAHVGSWIAELDGSDRLAWSAETYRIFGVPVGDFEGTTEGFYAFVHPDDRAAVRVASAAAILDRQAYDLEHRIVTGSGLVRWVHEKAEVVRDRDGVATRMIGTVHDVTERRHLEEQLRHAQKLEAVGRLAGGVVHDLNNIITAIAGYAELALADLPAEHPSHQDVEEIRRAAARAASVTRQLLAFSRKQLFAPRTFDLNETVDGITRLLGRVLGEDIGLRLRLAPTLPPIAGDSGQVEQAIVNLALNARDAMPGGGELTIATAVEEVPPSSARENAPMRPGTYVLLTVSDTGQGIDAETKAHIFEPFFTTKDADKGTGLGLAMVYGTVKQSGGFIFVDSQLGQGATFQLYFPVVPIRTRRATPKFTPLPGQSGGTHGTETVLIVEDEEAVRKLVVATLASDGYQLLTAASAEQALDVARAHGEGIDLLLTDATMPGRSGTDLARELLAERPTLAIVVMSGYVQTAADLDPIGGSATLLQKPFTPNDLRTRVRQVLDRRGEL